MSKESKFLSRVLRHEPELVGLTLGTGGWVLVDDLLRGMKKAGHRLKRDDLELIMADNDKRRWGLLRLSAKSYANGLKHVFHSLSDFRLDRRICIE